MTQSEAFDRVVSVLRSEGVAFAVIGSSAFSAGGDVDMEVGAFPVELESVCVRTGQVDQGSPSANALMKRYEVGEHTFDLFKHFNETFHGGVLSSVRRKMILGTEVRVASLEESLITKASAARHKERAKAARHREQVLAWIPAADWDRFLDLAITLGIHDDVLDYKPTMSPERRAILLARYAETIGQRAVGAVIEHRGNVVGVGYNKTSELSDPTAHAEMVVLRAACKKLGSRTLEGATVFSSLEPCPMCWYALQIAKVSTVVYSAADPIGGAVSRSYQLVSPWPSHVMSYRLEPVV